MAGNDPFDDYWEESNSDSPRRAGRPRTRQVREKGPIGRPRVRPLENKYSRKRGRPALNAGSVADRIEKEAIISGSYGSKGIAGSVKTLEKTVTVFQKQIVTPLAKSISSFSKSVNDFNRYHQQYLKDQIAVSREIHETFKLFRKASIDPLIRTMARSRKGTQAISEVMNEIYATGKYDKNYEKLVQRMTKFDEQLEKTVKTSVVGVEMTDTFLKEYYKTSKGTSKFLNAVAYATEDIADDINALKDNMAKYFKGSKSNKSVLVDQTETLKRIEQNTKAPSIGRRIMSSAFSGAVAMGKTMFKYNRYGTMDWLSQLTGMKLPSPGEMAKGNGPLSGLFKVLDDALAIQIREKVRDASGNLRNTFQEASMGVHGPVAEGLARGASRVGRGIQRVFISNLQQLGANITAAWNKEETKQRARWFWEVAKTMGFNFYQRAGMIGERQVEGVISNYSKKNYQGPHGGRGPQTREELIEQFIRGENRLRASSFGDFSENASGSSTPLAYDPFGAEGASIWGNRGGNVITGNFTKRASSSKGSVIQGPWGKGAGVVSLNPKSENQIPTADVSTPKKAFASLAKIQGRTLGYIEKLWKKFKDNKKEDEKKDGGFFKDLGGKLGGLLGAGGLAALLMKNRGLLRGKGGKGVSALGKLVFGTAAFKRAWKGLRPGMAKAGSKHAVAAARGSTLRTLWDTFGWGNIRGKGSMGALAGFKNTRLGQSAIGDFIRRARISQVAGKDLGSRLLGGMVTANKWGGLRDPLGALAGLGNALGVKNVGKWYAPKFTLEGRKAISAVGGAAAKGGSRVRGILNASKAAEFAAKNPLIAKVAGAGVIGKMTAAGAAPFKAMGKAMTKIPSKNKLLGGILGGVGLKAIGKIGGKGAAKALAKQIPILGAIVGIGFGIHRFVKGDVLGGILEIVSGLLTLVPSGAGNAAALGIDAFLIGRDIHKSKAGKGKSPIDDKDKKKILGTFGVKTEGSQTNYVAEYQQQNGGQAGSPGKLPPSQEKPGIGTAISNAVNTAVGRGKTMLAGMKSALTTGAAGGEKTIVDKDTGAIKWNGKRHDRLLPGFKKAFFSAANDFYKTKGKQVVVNSCIRTDEEQADLYARWKKGDPGVMTPALPVYDYKLRGITITGSHREKGRTGHLVGGAVDIQNWSEFKPFALKYGLKWQGPKDPVHFQTNETGPIICNSKPANTYKSTDASAGAKTGDGGSAYSSSAASVSSAMMPGGGSSTVGAGGSKITEISPMIEDMGLAIINNLLFSF